MLDTICYHVCFIAIRSPCNREMNWIFESHKSRLLIQFPAACWVQCIYNGVFLKFRRYGAMFLVMHKHFSYALMTYSRLLTKVCPHYSRWISLLASLVSDTVTAGAIFRPFSLSSPVDKAGSFMVDLKEIRATNLPLPGCYKAGNALRWRMIEAKRARQDKCFTFRAIISNGKAEPGEWFRAIMIDFTCLCLWVCC